jgi:excisionase family DNA binding protein
VIHEISGLREEGIMDYHDYQGLSISEVAQRLAVSTRTVHRYLKKGLLEAKRDGSRVYVSEESLRKIDSLKAAKVQGLVDPTRHVVVERDDWQDTVTRLAQLETEQQYLLGFKEEVEKKDKELNSAQYDLGQAEECSRYVDADLQRIDHALETATEELKVKEAALIGAQAQVEFLEQELTWLRRPWWRRIFGRKAYFSEPRETKGDDDGDDRHGGESGRKSDQM